MKDSHSSAGGIGIVGLLQVAFIVLKLCAVIEWSWLWVLSPIWISAAVSVALLVFLVICAVIKARKTSKKRISKDVEV